MPIPTLTIGPLGGTMNSQLYMPDGALGFEIPTTVLPTLVVVDIPGTGETWTAAGDFTYGSSNIWPFLTGSVNSIEYQNAQGTLLYGLTGLDFSVSSYLKYAESGNWIGFEEAALGTNGEIVGTGNGDDYFLGLAPGSYTYTGGGGTNTLDYSALNESGQDFVIDVASGTVSISFSGSGTTTFSNIQVFYSPQTAEGEIFITARSTSDRPLVSTGSLSAIRRRPRSSTRELERLTTNLIRRDP
jgi:hypothetical protein